MEKRTPPQITHQLNKWRFWFIVWNALHWTLGLVAVLFGTLAAAFKQHAGVYGTIAATASALLSAAHPYQRSLGFERAHRKLNNARIRFETLEASTVEALVKANEDAGAILEDSEKSEKTAA